MTLKQFARAGGNARAKKLKPEMRSEIARHAATTRWRNPKPAKRAKAAKVAA